MCVCVCSLCVLGHVYTYTHLYVTHTCTTRVPQIDFKYLPLFLSTLFFERETHMEPEAYCLVSPWDITDFFPLTWGLQVNDTCPVSYVGTGDLNSGPHVRTSGTLPNEPSPSPELCTF